MKIITCITDSEHIGYKYGLYASCKHHKLDLISLISDDKDWKSHRNKDNNLKKYLEKQHPKEIILFTDGYDAIFIGSESEILERYEKETGFTKILISAEINCYPANSLAEYYPKVKSPYKYLNSGGFIGSAEQILKVLNDLEKAYLWMNEAEYNIFEWSNQYLWTLAYLKRNQEIMLDTDCILFQSLAVDIKTSLQLLSFIDKKRQVKSFSIKKMNELLTNFKIRNGKINNIATQSYPIHLHFNTPITKFGMFRPPFLSIIEKMN